MRERVLKGLGVLVILTALLSPGLARAWGERGHHVICEVASRLVREEGLKSFLATRDEMMGHLCNIPDIYWRGLGAISQSGDATHFIDAEAVPMPLKAIPLQYGDLISTKFAKPIDIPSEFGSLWWRAEQFYQRAGVAGRRAAGSPAPAREKQQDPKDPYNSAVFDLITNMGLMGHFVGDASMPYHNTTDYDGWGAHHGGIHSYYETEVVSALPLTLLQNVYVQGQKKYAAQRAGKKIKAKSSSSLVVNAGSDQVVARMKELSIAAQGEISKVQALDKLISPSKIEKDVEGKSVKIPAKRPPASQSASRFRKLIESELASSAALLAQLWDTIYIESGRPDLSAYKSYQYPHEPEFVPPDYIPTVSAPAVNTEPSEKK